MDDYKARFIEEYYELGIRIIKLDCLLMRHEAGLLDFELDCPAELLREQLIYMKHYLGVLNERALIEVYKQDWSGD